MLGHFAPISSDGIKSAGNRSAYSRDVDPAPASGKVAQNCRESYSINEAWLFLTSAICVQRVGECRSSSEFVAALKEFAARRSHEAFSITAFDGRYCRERDNVRTRLFPQLVPQGREREPVGANRIDLPHESGRECANLRRRFVALRERRKNHATTDLRKLGSGNISSLVGALRGQFAIELPRQVIKEIVPAHNQ
jgi:hypothetical protein